MKKGLIFVPVSECWLFLLSGFAVGRAVDRRRPLSRMERLRSLRESDLCQLFVKDPNRLVIELNFFGMKDIIDWGGEDFAAMPRTVVARH